MTAPGNAGSRQSIVIAGGGLVGLTAAWHLQGGGYSGVEALGEMEAMAAAAVPPRPAGGHS